MRSSRGAVVAVLLSLIGIGLCAYLTYVHIALLRGELVGGAACGAAGSIFNCHAVTASALGRLFGIPLSLWGLVGYLATLSLAFIAWQFSDWADRALTALVALSLLFVLVDARLLVGMLVEIRYVCPLCLLTYAVNLLLLALSAWALARPWPQIFRQVPAALIELLPRPRVPVVWILWGVVATGAAGIVSVHAATTFISQGPPGTLRKQMEAYVSQQHRVSVDTSGNPTIGAAQPAVRIVEFSDFFCPSCQRASQFNPIIVASHRKEASFTFKHFPLDMACNDTVRRTMHPNACRIAAAAACAHEQGKFWPFHDRVFEKGPAYNVADLERDASRAGLELPAFRSCLESGRGLERVKRDIAEAGRLGVNSTPTYFINGIQIVGALTPVMFDELLRAVRESGS